MGFTTNTSGSLSTRNSNPSLNQVAYNANEGTVVACTNTTITLENTASSTDDMYNDCLIEIMSGSGNGTTRRIIDYDGTTKIVTVDTMGQGSMPDTNSTYVIHKNSGVLESQTQSNRKKNVLLPSHFSSINGFYSVSVIKLTKPNGSHETRYIRSYDGTTKLATLTEPLNEAPEEGDYCIVAGEAGSAQAGTTNTITLDGNQSSSVKAGLVIGIYYGPGHSEIRQITDITGNVATVNGNWNTIPDNTSLYCIYTGWAGGYESIVNYSKVAYTTTFMDKERVMALSSLSTDGTDPNGIHHRREIYETNKGTYTVAATAHFFRIILVGIGTSITGSVQTTLGFQQGKVTTTFGDRVDDSSDCNLVRSVVTAKSSDNGQYKNVNVDHKGNLNVNLNDPRDSFGHIAVASPKPIIELKFPYSTSHFTQDYFFKGSAVFNNSGDNVLTAMTGIPPTTFAPYSTARLKSLYRTPYSAGLGLSVKFSGIFSPGVSGCKQLLGHGDENNGYFFGYDGTKFGILRRYAGKNEIQKLTIDTGASTTGDVTVTLEGVSTVIPVIAGDSVHTVARKIFKGVMDPYGLQNNFAYIHPGWKTYEDGNSVIFVSQISGPYTGTFSITGQGVTGTWTEIQHGNAPSEDWTYVENWNIDRVDNTEALPVIDFSKGNVFQIDIQWLGFGNIEFKILNPKSGNFSTVHHIRYPNEHTSPSIYNPHQPLCMEVDTGAGATFVSAGSACLSSHVLGQVNITNGTRLGASIIKKGSVTKDRKYNIMTLRNDVTLMGILNVIEMFGLTIASSWKGVGAAIFHTIVGAELEIPYSVSINAGGTGYDYNEVQGVTGGAGSGMELRIVGVGPGGSVTHVEIERPGSGYIEQDQVTLQGGSGCTIDVTHQGLTWTPRKANVSIASICTDYVEVTGGNEYFSIPLGTDDSFFDKFNDLEIYMPPRYSLTLAIQPIQDEIDAEFSASFFWSEKH